MGFSLSLCRELACEVRNENCGLKNGMGQSVPDRIEGVMPNLPRAPRDQPGLEWMGVVGVQVVAKVDWSLVEEEQPAEPQDQIRPEPKDVYVFDGPTGRFLPVAFPHGNALVDFSVSDESIVVLCRDGRWLNLLTFCENSWRSERLPDDIPSSGSVRMVANNDLLILFSGGCAVTRLGRTWRRFVELFPGSESCDIPREILCTEDSVYAGYNAGEWGGALFRFDKVVHRFEKCILDGLPVTGISEDGDGHVWVSTGLAHEGSVEGALYEYDGAHWENVVPQKVPLPVESDITGIGFMPSGGLRVVAGTLGLVELKGNVFHPIVKVDWYETGDSLYTQGLVVDGEGRNFVGTFDAGVFVFATEEGRLTVRRLTFEFNLSAISIEDIWRGIALEGN